MPVLGITGGIATGKSSFVRALRTHLPGELFDADQAAHDLLASDETVRAGVTSTFGPAALDSTGRPDRRALRELVFAEPAARARLEAILHPPIRARWLAEAAAFKTRPAWLFVDIPLLYETEAQAFFERVVVIACSRATQIYRLRERRHLGDALIARILDAQYDLGGKVRQAHHVVWNDSSPACLDGQAQLLACLLRNLYG